MRESMALADIAMKKDGLDERWNFREGWIDDIYDSRLHEGRLRNVSDDEKYDSKLCRARAACFVIYIRRS
jgi:hypothetical protein